MNLLFLDIEIGRSWPLAAPGPAHMAPILRAAGHRVRLERVPAAETPEETLIRVQALAPDLIGLSLTTHQWPRARDLAAFLRRRTRIPLVAGGLHPTFAPEQVLAADGIDYVCLGEGDRALPALANAVDRGQVPNNIPNLWVQGGSRPEIGPPADSDHQPWPDRDILDERHGLIHVITGRGCPFPCTYCAAGALGRLYQPHAHYRRRSPENVIGELEAIRQNRPLHYVIFLDDTFTHPPAWIREFLPLYEQRLQTPFSAHARVDTVTPDLIRSLVRAGCRHVVFGVESGSERVRKTILGRPLTDDRILLAFAMTQDAGLLTTANYMMGLPGETRADVDQTLAFNRRLGPDDFGFFVYVPYPGTPLADMCQEKGYLPDQPFERPIEPGESILTMPDLSRDDIRKYFQAFIEARQDNYRRRFGSTLPAEGLDAALAQIAADARI